MNKLVKLNIIFGIPILLCYFILLPKIDMKKLWVGMNNKEKIFTIISLTLSVCIYIYYIFNGNNNLYYPMMVFLIGALLWPIMLYLNINKFLVILALFITSIGSVMIMKQNFNIFTLLLVFHVIFTDNILWGYKYLNK